MEKLNELWLKVPQWIREVIKEVGRWSVATIYSLIVDMATTGELFSTPFETVVRVILFRFGDRVLYILSQQTTRTKVQSWMRSLLLIK